MRIESVQNPKIKQVLQLQQKSKLRNTLGLFVVEGTKEISLALTSEFEVDHFFYREDFQNRHILEELNKNALSYEVPEQLFEKIAYRSTSGILAIFKQKNHTLDNLTLPENPLIIILESVEKPGNLGAILRTADAAKVAAVLICDPLVDAYNPNVVRASLGCLFTVPIIVSSSTAIRAYVAQKNITVFTSYLHENTINVYDANLSQPAAIVLGTEATGVSNFWVQQADYLIKIPMQGAIDSLNVSTAAAIILFESVRQRLNY